MELVDILLPPTFQKSGQVKTLDQAWNDGDWIGTFNLWIVQNYPTPAIVYQQRSPKSSWAPSKLDVTAGGHYDAGEELYDGLREVREELGKNYSPQDIKYLGRKLHVSPDTQGRMRQNVVEIFMTLDNSPISSYTLQQSEVYAICACPIPELIKAHTIENYSFEINTLTNSGSTEKLIVTKNSFPYNYDNYHYKIALLAKRFIFGKETLIY